jgi:hypothetical protein
MKTLSYPENLFRNHFHATFWISDDVYDLTNVPKGTNDPENWSVIVFAPFETFFWICDYLNKNKQKLYISFWMRQLKNKIANNLLVNRKTYAIQKNIKIMTQTL